MANDNLTTKDIIISARKSGMSVAALAHAQKFSLAWCWEILNSGATPEALVARISPSFGPETVTQRGRCFR